MACDSDEPIKPKPIGVLPQEAYAETIRAAAAAWGPAFPRTRSFRSHVIGQFTGPAYGWMWPFRRSIERWYDRVLGTIA